MHALDLKVRSHCHNQSVHIVCAACAEAPQVLARKFRFLALSETHKHGLPEKARNSTAATYICTKVFCLFLSNSKTSITPSRRCFCYLCSLPSSAIASTDLPRINLVLLLPVSMFVGVYFFMRRELNEEP